MEVEQKRNIALSFRKGIGNSRRKPEILFILFSCGGTDELFDQHGMAFRCNQECYGVAAKKSSEL